jgi:LysR family glycine cleavage system transcriptional activator
MTTTQLGPTNADPGASDDELNGRARGSAGFYGRPLPSSMSSLRAFEAVARRQSFTKAAAELCLTQTAVSHQVGNLEKFLRTRLLIRDRDGVHLSEAGKLYLQSVRAALNSLSFATQRILDQDDAESLSILSLAAFGLKCLLPLLPDFRRRYPHIRIRFENVISYDAAASYNYDVSIRYGDGTWPGMKAHKISAERVFPVCSPAFQEEARMKEPQDMFKHTAICTSSLVFRDDWPEWLAHYGYSQADFLSVISCDTMLSASQAAIDGLGLAMGREPLVNRDLAEGRLVAPFEHRISSSTGYYVMSSEEQSRRPAARLFTDWLLEKFAVQP